MTDATAPRPHLDQIETGTLQAQIYASLKTAVMQGEFAPSQNISLRDMAARFGVSTMPVRGAIQQLIADGALHFTSSRSVSVPAMNPERLDDLRQVRLSIETTAVEWAAQRITADEIAELHRLSAAYGAVYDEKNLSRHIAGHLASTYRFRFAAYRASRSPVLVEIIETLWLRIAPYFNLLRDDWPAVVDQSVLYRKMLIAAFELRDGNAARAAIHGEIRRVSDMLMEKLGSG